MCSRPSRPLLLLPLMTALLMGMAAPATSTSFTQSCFASYGFPAVSVVDFNNDGNLDVAVSPGTAAGSGFTLQPSFNVYLGDGLGGFTLGSQVATVTSFLYMTAADVNNDGNQDLANSGDFAGPFSINRGNGDGTFQAGQPVAGAGDDAVAFVDLNQDGFLDLLTGEERFVVVQLNQGDGTFGAGVDYRVGFYVRALTTADVDGDGLRDALVLILTNGGHTVVTVLPNRGDGTLGKASKSTISAGGYAGRGIRTADFNGDGEVDVAVPRLQGGGVTVAFGDGTGSFNSATDYSTTGLTNQVDVGDLNGDGNIDIVTGNNAASTSSPTGTVTVFYGNGSGSFTLGNVIAVNFGLGVAVADINEDTHLDIVEDTCALLNDGTPAAAHAARSLGTKPGSGDSAVLTASFSPNPATGSGVLDFSLPRDGTVSIHLYDIRGRRVHTLADGLWMLAGPHALHWDRRAARLSTGIYFYRIETEGSQKSGRIVIASP